MMPLAGFLLPNKSAETYLRMFTLIQDHAASKGLVFQIDFERAVLNTIDEFFPAAEMKGSTFYFTQAVWENVQLSGLVVHYKTDPDVKK